MNTSLDWIIIAGISITILLFFLCLFLLYSRATIKKQIKKLEKSRRRKKKSTKKKVEKLKETRSSRSRWLLITVVLTLLIGAGTGYARYYQATTLDAVDTDNIVYSYYLINELETKISDIEQIDEEEGGTAFHELAVQVSSFTTKKGSSRGKKESQYLLNRYYARTGQLGVNLAGQGFKELKESKELQEDYLEDIKMVKKDQSKVLAYYKIDETSLQQKK